MKTFCTCLSGKTNCDCQNLELIVTDRTDLNNRKDMTKEEKNKAENFLDAYLGGNRNVSTLTWNHWVECLHDYGSKLQSENERLKAERDSNWISLERAKKYARHQHYLGTQGSELVEFEDWECKPPKQ